MCVCACVRVCVLTLYVLREVDGEGLQATSGDREFLPNQLTHQNHTHTTLRLHRDQWSHTTVLYTLYLYLRMHMFICIYQFGESEKSREKSVFHLPQPLSLVQNLGRTHTHTHTHTHQLLKFHQH